VKVVAVFAPHVVWSQQEAASGEHLILFGAESQRRADHACLGSARAGRYPNQEIGALNRQYPGQFWVECVTTDEQAETTKAGAKDGQILPGTGKVLLIRRQVELVLVSEQLTIHVEEVGTVLCCPRLLIKDIQASSQDSGAKLPGQAPKQLTVGFPQGIAVLPDEAAETPPKPATEGTGRGSGDASHAPGQDSRATLPSLGLSRDESKLQPRDQGRSQHHACQLWKDGQSRSSGLGLTQEAACLGLELLMGGRDTHSHLNARDSQILH
jgi:hypothetical protein